LKLFKTWKEHIKSANTRVFIPVKSLSRCKKGKITRVQRQEREDCND